MRRMHAQTSLGSDNSHIQVQGCADYPGLALGAKDMTELTLCAELALNARESQLIGSTCIRNLELECVVGDE